MKKLLMVLAIILSLVMSQFAYAGQVTPLDTTSKALEAKSVVTARADSLRTLLAAEAKTSSLSKKDVREIVSLFLAQNEADYSAEALDDNFSETIFIDDSNKIIVTPNYIHIYNFEEVAVTPDHVAQGAIDGSHGAVKVSHGAINQDVIEESSTISSSSADNMQYTNILKITYELVNMFNMSMCNITQEAQFGYDTVNVYVQYKQGYYSFAPWVLSYSATNWINSAVSTVHEYGTYYGRVMSSGNFGFTFVFEGNQLFGSKYCAVYIQLDPYGNARWGSTFA